MTDYISRQDAINALENTDCELLSEEWDMLTDSIMCIPAAPVREVKRGRWECGDDMFEYAVCSVCKWDSGEAWEYAKKNFSYCPNCGSDNREEGR